MTTDTNTTTRRAAELATPGAVELRLEGHGFYRATLPALEVVTANVAHLSDDELRAHITDRTELDYADVASRTALLIILTDIDGVVA